MISEKYSGNLVTTQLTTRVAVIDDSFVMRAGFAQVVPLAPDFEFIGQGATLEEALEIGCQQAPHVILLDYRLLKASPPHLSRQLFFELPETRIIVTSWNDDPKLLIEVILAGARGFLVHGKYTPPELISGINIVRQGGLLIPPTLTPLLLRLAIKGAQAVRLDVLSAANINHISAAPEVATLDERYTNELLLTRRENTILGLVQQGKSNREIARHLVIEEKTVKNHINRIYNKLQIRNRYEAINLSRPFRR